MNTTNAIHSTDKIGLLQELTWSIFLLNRFSVSPVVINSRRDLTRFVFVSALGFD